MRVSLILLLVGLTASIAVSNDTLNESTAIEKIELLGGKIKEDDTVADHPVIEVDFKANQRFSYKELHLLKPFKSLARLNVSQTEITDVGMKAIGGFSSLTTLYINKAQITDVGLTELRGLRRLTTLHIIGNGISDEGLKAIGELTNLTKLHIGRTEITESGLKELKKLTRLTELNLIGTNINDAGLKEISEIKTLTKLLLGRNEITDSGLTELSKLKDLKLFVYYRNNATSNGESKLKEFLPNLVVSGSKPTKLPTGAFEVLRVSVEDADKMSDKDWDKLLNNAEGQISRGKRP